MKFYRNFLFEYSLIGIVKPKVTRKNEICCRILEIDLSKNVRKKQDRTSSMSPSTNLPHNLVINQETAHMHGANYLHLINKLT